MNKMAIGGGVGTIINETSLYRFIAYTLKIIISNTLHKYIENQRGPTQIKCRFFRQKVDYFSNFT